ncbi:hypothetical protein TNCT_370241 [Trichonephila clavata]|uniref:Uncharacterized protein n=1 Tax=Trichonephila clavata TaxID=2740835 RepID=A0A8X6GMX6_TRICU|nr:hypothetical protein TNCT_370241 [Trichonephila clavata]
MNKHKSETVPDKKQTRKLQGRSENEARNETGIRNTGTRTKLNPQHWSPGNTTGIRKTGARNNTGIRKTGARNKIVTAS